MGFSQIRMVKIPKYIFQEIPKRNSTMVMAMGVTVVMVMFVDII